MAGRPEGGDLAPSSHLQDGRNEKLRIRRARVVEDGLTDQVLDDPQHAYTQMLVASILPV